MSFPTARWRTTEGKGVTNLGKDLRLQDLYVPREAKITVKGKAGRLVDIDKGAKIILELEMTGGVIVLKSLEVLGE